MKLLSHIFKRGWNHRHFFRWSTAFKTALRFPMEFHLAGRSIFTPAIINLLPTLRCNLNCELCHAGKLPSNNELKPSQWLSFIEHCQGFSPDWFLSGGEPFLYSGTPGIIAKINELKMRVSAVTNGQLLEKKLPELPQNALASLFFSVLGTEAEHDRITGLPGSFIKLKSAIHAFSSHSPKTALFLNVPLSVKLIDNLPEFAEEIKGLPIKSVRFSQLNWLHPDELESHKTAASACGLINHQAHSWIQSEPMSELASKISSLLEKTLPFPWFFDIPLDKKQLQEWYSLQFPLNRSCYFLWVSPFIYPDGQVCSCQFLREPFGNITTQSIESIWKNSHYQSLRGKLKKGLLPGCSRCCKL